MSTKNNTQDMLLTENFAKTAVVLKEDNITINFY